MGQTQTLNHARLQCLLRVADGSLILAQRQAEWCGHAPVLEEDIAFTNIALDLLGQARLLYTHAGVIEGEGRDEDAFAYWRGESEFLNPTIVELPNGDFAHSVLRSYLYCAYQQTLWAALTESRDAGLVAISQKSAKETRYHVEHLALWVRRLGDGTAESHTRMQRAVDYLWPYCSELLVSDPIEQQAHQDGMVPLSTALEAPWRALVETCLRAATLSVPTSTPFRSTGRVGRHSEHLGRLLAEMQSLARAHPGGKW